jgi:2-dehydropantoate 2-reductase
MRIAVIGAGGVGGYFGAKLAQGGHDVAFVARGAHLDALRAGGLRIESAAGDIVLPKVRVTDDPATLEPVDVAMFCVKLWDVDAAAAKMGPLVRAGVVIPFQNGIDSAGILERAIGAEHVLGGVAYIAASIRAPGVVAQVGTMARLRVGAFDASAGAQRAQAFVDACTQAGIDAEHARDIRRALWEKFVFLTALSGVTCLARQPLGVIRDDPDLRATFEASMRETNALARAQGVALADDFIATQLRALDSMPPQMRSSMLNDLVAGHRLEAPWLCGRVAQMAPAMGIAAPVNATLYAALKPYIDGTRH